MRQKRIIIGTRGSLLSLTQTRLIRDLLQKVVPKTHIEIITITTAGDKNMEPIPLDTVGKGWFTREIDRQLLDKKIDLAVHSLKDLEDSVCQGLMISAITKREDAREALVSRNGLPLEKLKKRAVIGTDSVRRKIQILRMRPDIVIKSVRGNVNRRLEKLDNGDYDGLCLAVAGLKRLGLEKRITQYFDATDFIPSPGQGALAIMSRADDKKLHSILSRLRHKSSIAAVTAEREFSKATGGGCSMPIGAYATVWAKTITLHGMVGSLNGEYIVKGVVKGSISDPKNLGKRLAEKLLGDAASWYHPKHLSESDKRVIVLTRTEEENKSAARLLKGAGFKTYSCPSIAVVANTSSKKMKKYLALLPSFQWIVFTSSNGARFFIDGLLKAGGNIADLKHLRIAVVGEKTAKTVREFKLPVSFIPSIFTSENLAKELPDVRGAKILLPRSKRGRSEFYESLTKRGAKVTDMPVYTTISTPSTVLELKEMLQNNAPFYLTFSSPSTITGFLQNFTQKERQLLQSLPVFSIGPVTTNAAKKHGFLQVHTARTHTIEGIMHILKENLVYS